MNNNEQHTHAPQQSEETDQKTDNESTSNNSESEKYKIFDKIMDHLISIYSFFCV